MNTQKKKLLTTMILSAMITCPVWAETSDAGTTGYEPFAEGQNTTVKAAAPLQENERAAVNATVMEKTDATATAAMAGAQSGLTGYETPEELAAIQNGSAVPAAATTPAASSAATPAVTTPAATANTGLTGYETPEEIAARQNGATAAAAPAEEIAPQQAPAETATEENTAAGVLAEPPKGAVPYIGGLGEVQVDSSLPKYPIAILSQAQEAALPYGNLVSDTAMAPYVGKVAASVAISPLPDQAIGEKIKPRLAMRAGDTIDLNYLRHDLNVIGSTGLFSAVVPQVAEIPEGVALTYAVQMNPIVHGIEIKGNESIKTEDLMKAIHVQPETVLNSTILSKDVYEINTMLANSGYLMSHIDSVHIDDQGILHIDMTEGHLEDVIVRGNTKTKTRVITREMRMKKGDVFNKAQASRSVQRIYNTGYFEDVNVRLLPGRKNQNDVIMEIDVAEQKTGTVTIGAGYSQSDGLVGILGLSETNLRGTGDKANINWEFGGHTHSKYNYTFGYTHPWLNDHGDSIGFNIFNREGEYEDYDEKGNSVSQYDKKTSGFNITYGRVRSEYVSDFVTAESKKTEYTGWEGSGYDYKDYPTYLANNFGRTNSLSWSHVYDNRDNVYDPTSGKRLSFTTTWAGHGLGGDFDYYKFLAEERLYYKVGSSQVIAVRLMGGIADGDMPYNDLFTLGGADTLRGYEDDEFRGNKMYEATIEYRYPIAKKIQGVVFTDLGNACGGVENIPWYHENNKLHYSGGIGFRITTPIGPIRLDYGVGQDGGKFHFSFGGKF